jgi:hypothetical protein
MAGDHDGEALSGSQSKILGAFLEDYLDRGGPGHLC